MLYVPPQAPAGVDDPRPKGRALAAGPEARSAAKRAAASPLSRLDRRLTRRLLYASFPQQSKAAGSGGAMRPKTGVSIRESD
jgi:hypothetical protein